ncbi:receptor expression-enhancing protein 2-like isoform X4 [Branchiostoma floridae]|uniref:Receptor expression-enhancing protein 2-like isoform X4 n=1 Tax=Branchiostoma floridae TaxID=7739 RepID=A0A9J7L3C4_BRAFL|nr:receptor expression-enhancing protein 2-like isoform X4 [Branchiostoma floridae]
MVSAIISRFVVLLFGTLYPAYASYKAVKTKNVREYVKWMMYWIVFALFTCMETFADVFISWVPFYYEVKIVFVVWLLSPYTKGSSFIYRKFVHPALSKREKEIDEYIAQASERSYETMVKMGKSGLNMAATAVAKTAIKILLLPFFLTKVAWTRNPELLKSAFSWDSSSQHLDENGQQTITERLIRGLSTQDLSTVGRDSSSERDVPSSRMSVSDDEALTMRTSPVDSNRLTEEMERQRDRKGGEEIVETKYSHIRGPRSMLEEQAGGEPGPPPTGTWPRQRKLYDSVEIDDDGDDDDDDDDTDEQIPIKSAPTKSKKKEITGKVRTSSQAYQTPVANLRSIPEKVPSMPEQDHFAERPTLNQQAPSARDTKHNLGGPLVAPTPPKLPTREKACKETTTKGATKEIETDKIKGKSPSKTTGKVGIKKRKMVIQKL